MNYTLISNLISSIAEAQHLAASQDELSTLVLRYAPKSGGEIGADELQYVSAARAQSYDDFIKRVGKLNTGK